jgi:hypothetical protein
MRHWDERPNPKQAQAVEAIASGADVARAADASGVDRETLRDWLEHDAAFIARVNRAKTERAEQLRAEVRDLASQAIATLRVLVSGPETPAAVRLRAALAILQAADAMRTETIGSASVSEIQSELSRRDLFASLVV